jgi:IclR family KDG regulon transcriptional repressor
MEQTYFVPSVDTASRVLEMLTRYRTRSSTLSEISTALQVSKTTCLRVLKTLESHGLLRYDEETKRYSLGYYCVVLGARAAEGLDYLAYVGPLLRECARRTGLTAAFVQRVSTDRMMYVAKEESGQAAHVNVSIGNRFPITEVSYGKWVLAFAGAAEREELLASGLRQVTPQTISDVEDYLKQVDALAAEGVLVSRAEYIRGVVAVSCPVLDTKGGLVGVLAVLGLTEALPDEDLESVCAVMRDIAPRCHFDGRSPRHPVTHTG